MARQGITEEQVFEAAGQLQEEGLAITSNSVRDKLGTGSFSTINTLLAKWREANLIPDMPNTLNRAVQQLWTIAWKEAQDNVKVECEALVLERRKIELEYQGMLEEISQLETNIVK
ncbi:MAG: DNA-binding protein, partial [Methylobacter sp.]